MLKHGDAGILHLGDKMGIKYCLVNTLMSAVISDSPTLMVEDRHFANNSTLIYGIEKKLLTCNISRVYRRFLLDHQRGSEAPPALI